MTTLTANLLAFPQTDGNFGDLSVAASCAFLAGSRLAFEYRVTGRTDLLRLPPVVSPRRTEGLWRHTCFESFVAIGDAEYLEFNFSPSGEWAAYAFAGYRVAAPEPALIAPHIECAVATGGIVLTATIDAAAILAAARSRPVAMNLTAVLETQRGARGYFAAHHPAERPDFHDRRGFVLAVDTRGASS